MVLNVGPFNMEVIFHEKQEGSLCAQHCLNSLLQGAYFTAVDLSTLAKNLDEQERQQMAESGTESEEYIRFLAQPSGNMDDSGYFSVQVISSALQVWELELVPYSSTDDRARQALSDPSQMRAFICNYRDHWLTIRKLGKQWFNLNSLLKKPELISDTYLALFLAQLKNDGYSIFIVFGELPECTADQVLLRTPYEPPRHPASTSHMDSIDNDSQIQEALRMSLIDEVIPPEFTDQTTEEERELQEALRLSLQSASDLRHESDDEESLLRKAINMSLQC